MSRKGKNTNFVKRRFAIYYREKDRSCGEIAKLLVLIAADVRIREKEDHIELKKQREQSSVCLKFIVQLYASFRKISFAYFQATINASLYS